MRPRSTALHTALRSRGVLRLFLALVVFAALCSACGGGGGGVNPTAPSSRWGEMHWGEGPWQSSTP